MALCRHRLPTHWLYLTLAIVMCSFGAAFVWRLLLPQHLAQAAADGDLEACLRYSEQLSALRSLDGTALGEQALCRRTRARQLWERRDWRAALGLQRQLVDSLAADRNDRLQLQRWQAELQQQALRRFQQGELSGALILLEPLGRHHNNGGGSLGDDLRSIWSNNRHQLERAGVLTSQKRWWEAADALNRIDHPWWKRRAESLRSQVEAGISGLAGAERQHDSHGVLPHTVAAAELDRQVQQRISQGMDEWSALQAACRSLGGRVIEAGPESACRR